MWILAAPLLQVEMERHDLTLNWIIIGALLAVANREIRAGKPRDLALRDLGARAGVGDVISLAATLAHAERLGTSIACSLRIFADSMRLMRHKRAEKLVAKATIKLIFPLLLCIFPALLIVLMGPAISEISELFRSTGR
jgi:tight adherence protein C